MFHPFAQDLWLCDGPVVTAAIGFRYPTRMAVIRLPGDALVIWSPVALTGEIRDAICDLGQVAHIVAPNTLHDSFLSEWTHAFPGAGLHAAPGLAKRRPDLHFSGTLGDEAPKAWRENIDQVVVRGNAITTEVVFFHRASGTVLFTDLLQQFPDGWFRGWRAVVARLDLMTAPEPSVPRKFRVAFRNKREARAAIGRILDWPATGVVMAHGSPVTQEAGAFLTRAFNWLAPTAARSR